MNTKEHIMRVAVKLFSQRGITNTTVEEITKEGNISKKTLYFIFRSKNSLIEQSFGWKMQSISAQVDMVIGKELKALEKMCLYVNVICSEIADISITVLLDLANLKSLTSAPANEYLKRAVFIRFNKLLDQAKSEGLLKENVELGSALMDYWNILSPYLLLELKNDIPHELKSAGSLSIILRNQLLKIYSQILTPENYNRLTEIMTKSYYNKPTV